MRRELDDEEDEVEACSCGLAWTERDPSPLNPGWPWTVEVDSRAASFAVGGRIRTATAMLLRALAAISALCYAGYVLRGRAFLVLAGLSKQSGEQIT